MSRFVILCALASAACGGYRKHDGPDDDPCDDGVGSCSDIDGDGYGVGCFCSGPDCDDSNPEVWDEAQCEALCESDPHSAGCPCDAAEEGEPEVCYRGPEGTAGVGPCRNGLRRCSESKWSSCEGEVLPSVEICDDVDDDCDGEVDEGVVNECGGCGECERVCIGRGEGCSPWDVDVEGPGLEACPDEPDCVTILTVADRLRVAWLANTSEGTVSRIDTETRQEVGRYLTSPDGISAAPSPSRTAVDHLGEVVVANRAFGGQASVTKVGVDCADVDGDGRVETSTSRDDVLAWGDDECVEWHTEVGGSNAIARAIAVEERVGLDGVVGSYVWAGLYSEHRYVELESESGDLTGEEALVDPCTPYSAAMDSDGRLWSSCLSSTLVAFDTSNPDDVEVLTQPGSNYGIAVDWDGRVWTGGSCTIYDPADDAFTSIAGCNGASLAIDWSGDAWIGNCNGGICRVDADDLTVSTIAAASYGVAIDMHGLVWGVPAFAGYVDLIDPDTEEVERILDDCGGGPCLNGTYTYGDFTGFALVNHTEGLGVYSHVFDLGPGGGISWLALDWARSDDSGLLQFELRSAESLAALGVAPRVPVAITPGDSSPIDLADLDLGPGPLVEVTALFRVGDFGVFPRLYTIGIQYERGM